MPRGRTHRGAGRKILPPGPSVAGVSESCGSGSAEDVLDRRLELVAQGALGALGSGDRDADHDDHDECDREVLDGDSALFLCAVPDVVRHHEELVHGDSFRCGVRPAGLSEPCDPYSSAAPPARTGPWGRTLCPCARTRPRAQGQGSGWWSDWTQARADNRGAGRPRGRPAPRQRDLSDRA